MRVTQPALQPIAPMPFEPPADAPTRAFADWTPELPTEEDFAQVAAQARLGVQRKIVDEAARRKRQRLLAAGGIVVVVAGAIALLIDKFYDPVARAREQAIAAEVSRMTQQQKVTDDLTLIEIDIENAIMNNDLDAARRELATLIEKSPDHPRREFLQASIDRAAELAKLSPQTAQSRSQAASVAPAQAAVLPAASERAAPARPRPVERQPDRTPERVAARAPERTSAQRQSRENTPIAPRTYGAPISEPPRQPTIALDSPINAPPTTTARRSDNSFGGRTIEASDGSGMRTPTPAQPPAVVTKGSLSGSAAAGSAAVVMPPAAGPAPAPPAPLDVTPAKLVKRVTPVAPGGIPRKTAGYVVVRFTINESGRVADLAVVESQPQGVFDEAAQDAVRKWLYEPRKENGVAVQQPAKARLVFEAAN
jgi:protein TonB